MNMRPTKNVACFCQETKARMNMRPMRSVIRSWRMASTILIVCFVLLFPTRDVEAGIGMNWGRHTNQKLVASMVVDLLLQNGIREAKVFSPADNVMKAFSGSKIGLILSVSNTNLIKLTPEGAASWVSYWISQSATELDVEIRGIHVGIEPFSGSGQNANTIVDSLKNMQKALNDAGYGSRIKATVPHNSNVLRPNLTKPSEADFKLDIKEKMLSLIRILKDNNAPFVVHIHPLQYVHENNLDLEFAFFDNKSTHVVVDDNGLRYTNAFDFLYDSFLWALKKAGAPDMKIIVGQVGWPSDGYVNATAKTAERFYKGLMPKLVQNPGTPMLQGVPLDVYLHSLTDENKLNISLGRFNRHWGIYDSDGAPKYKLDLSGQGRNVYPTTAKGVTRMPKRWCVFNGDTRNMDKVREQVAKACNESDCTVLDPGGSCSFLTFDQKVSYAFNRFFQTKAQKESDDVCNFGGLGVIIPQNPTNGTCLFPVEILSAEIADNGSSLSSVLNNAPHRYRMSISAVLVLLFLIFLTTM